MVEALNSRGESAWHEVPRRLGVPENTLEPAFDRLARLAVAVLESSTALIWLVDGDRLFIKRDLRPGEPSDSASRMQSCRRLCQYIFDCGSPLIVNDPRVHPPVAEILAEVASGGACLGVPLIDGKGQRVGVLCVNGESPRSWGPAEVEILKDLAAFAMTEIELRADAIRRAQSEEALLASERRYRLQAENSNDMIARYDPHGVFLDASPACHRLLGYEPSELIGRPIYDLIHPEDLTAVAGAGEALMASPEVQLATCRLRHKDGRYLWVEGATRFVRDPHSGAILEVHGASRDVTERVRAEAALRLSEERYHLATLATNDAIRDWDLRTDVVWWNESVTRLFGHNLDEMGHEAARWYELLHPDDRERVAASVHTAIAEGAETWTTEYRFRRKDGSFASVIDRGVMQRDEQGVPTRMIGSMMDLTRVERAEAALLENRERLVAALHASGAGTFRWDVRTGSVKWDEQLDRLFGLPAGRTVRSRDEFIELIHPEDRAAIVRLCELSVSEGLDFTMEFRVVWPDGSIHWLDDRGKIVPDEEGKPLYMTGACVDITERKRADEHLAHQASHDALTALPNRTMLLAHLERCIASTCEGETPFALLVLDLDRFKEINDTFGHHYGDAILRQLSPLLLGSVRAYDMVARLGGDEFGILLPGTDELQAIEVADRILAGLVPPIVLDGQSFDVGVSIGIALHPEHGLDAVTLLKHADVAMYSAKRARAGRAIYTRGRDEHTPRRLRLVGELRRAIDGGQLRLYYQPTVDLRSMMPVGAEALVRWQHPRDGLLGPDEFVPIAEETGLIRPLGLWALREALYQRRAWRGKASDLRVSVNLSPENLQDDQLGDTIDRLLDEFEVPSRRLTVEVTEGAMMADPARAKAVLARLHRAGVLISIDDFGTGYSSLAYLKDMPADEVKVDRTFVRDMAVNKRDACIVRSVIELGHNLGLRVVAEGVEDRVTLDLLASWGCDLAQGFFLGHPLPAGELPAWLAVWEERHIESIGGCRPFGSEGVLLSTGHHLNLQGTSIAKPVAS
ncbi:EAL domain-containing protein [Singulisphaera sp. Ch08]|uniref:EAL domain-containing protein n=1 Tax=Singulisphaera sp. Ch08 TaxID=3120278 RepID=A0AAU7CLF8_9BACT